MSQYQDPEDARLGRSAWWVGLAVVLALLSVFCFWAGYFWRGLTGLVSMVRP